MDEIENKTEAKQYNSVPVWNGYAAGENSIFMEELDKRNKIKTIATDMLSVYKETILKNITSMEKILEGSNEKEMIELIKELSGKI